ncbi:hypothetical protein AAVH_18974 [Aphelenchoides avenae]|nr:hypothetical protein AAVH_18974 [Aphelenchus avenae]
MEQVRKIRDFRDLGEVVERERERAVITTGIIPVLQHSAEIERFLEANKEFAKEFGTFAQNAVYLAELYLGPVYSMQLYLDEDDLDPEDYEVLVDAVETFKQWLEKRLRAFVPLSVNLSLDVPEDPITGGELHLQGTLASGVLWMLSLVAIDPRPADINELIRIQRYSAAVFRLSFRDSDKMHYEESERKVVTAFLKRSIEVAQSNVEKGLLPAKALADELARIQKWKRDRERQEL